MPTFDQVCAGVIAGEIHSDDGGLPAFRASHIRPPLELRGPFHLDSAEHGYILRNVTAGVFPGDRLRVDLRAVSGAKCAVRHASATKVHRGSRHDPASSMLRLVAEPGAVLSFAESPLILQSGAEFSQSVELVAAGGVLCYSDVAVLGRLEHGECANFRLFQSSLRVISQTGLTIFGQRYKLSPEDSGCPIAESTPPVFGKLIAIGIHEGVIGAGWSRICDAAGPAYAGWDTLPNDAGVIMSVAGPCLERVEATLDAGRVLVVRSLA